MIEVHFQINIYGKCPNNSPPLMSENDNLFDKSHRFGKRWRRLWNEWYNPRRLGFSTASPAHISRVANEIFYFATKKNVYFYVEFWKSEKTSVILEFQGTHMIYICLKYDQYPSLKKQKNMKFQTFFTFFALKWVH